MTLLFSRNPQHADDIKLALSLDAPFIIDELIVVKGLNRLYERANEVFGQAEKDIYLDDLIRDLLYKGKNEGKHEESYECDGLSLKIIYETTRTGEKYTFEFS